MFNPVYYCVLSFNKKFLMKAVRLTGVKSKYLITTSDGILNEETKNNEKNNDIIGVLKSNFLGTEFNLFDSKKASELKAERDQSKIYLSIHYVCIFQTKFLKESNIFVCNVPRRISLYIPTLKQNDEYNDFIPRNKDDNLGVLYRSDRRTDQVIYLKIKPQHSYFVKFFN